MYCWSFTKGEAGARVEMKGHLSSDLVAHDGVKRFTDMQLGRSKVRARFRRPLATHEGKFVAD